jgi:methionyl-tRNA synthetase
MKPAQAFWLRCLEHDDIYKGRYEGYYCIGCEYYKTEKDLVDGKCPDHNAEPLWLSEENYFFRLSNYSEMLLAFFEQNPDVVKPRGKLEEAKNFIKSGLTDISISRRKEALLVIASELYKPIIPVSSQRALEALRAQQPVILYTKLF